MSEEDKKKTGATHRPYDEAFKRAAVAQWQSGVPARRLAEGLGITTESLRTWRRQLGGAQAESATVIKSKLPVVAPSTQELQAEVRRLRGQRDLRLPRNLLQPRAAPQRPRFPLPCGILKAEQPKLNNQTPGPAVSAESGQDQTP